MKLIPRTLIISLLGSGSLLAQGPLTPNSTLDPAVGQPNPLDGGNNPQSTMKTLHQVEPRMPVETTADTTDPNFHFVIKSAGSYYLTTNLFAFKTGGIRIDAEGVTLDLNGFEMRRFVVAGTGIEISSTAHRCVVKNGSIRDFGQAVKVIAADPACSGGSFTNLSVSGCNLAAIVTGESWTIDNCRVTGCTSSGITAANGSTISNCAVSNNPGSANAVAGILGLDGCTISNCSVSHSGFQVGIQGNRGTTIENCNVTTLLADASATESYGIFGRERNVIRGCSASFCRHAAWANSNHGVGIYAGNASLVTDCVATRNQGDGIIGFDRTRIVNNRASSNGDATDNTGSFPGTGAGIHITSGFVNHIIGNSVSDNDFGIDIDTSSNFVAKNIVAANGAGAAGNFEIVADNKVASIVFPPNSGALSGAVPAAAGVGTTDPWANIAY